VARTKIPGMPRLPVPQAIATLCLSFGLAAAPVCAQERPLSPLKTYANVLRVINPHLPDWQRRKYAASLLANAERTQIDPRFIMAIVTVESEWRSNAVSSSGARGLGQLMPSTAAELDVDARDASDNLRGTSMYLRSLLNRFRGQEHWFEKAIAGYNAGPYAVIRYGGVPPYAETQRYVVKVMRVYRQLYGSVALAPMSKSVNAGHHREEARRIAQTQADPAGGPALAAALNAGPTIPVLADAYALVPIPAYKSSF
jgi:soluble lytic murein transglycosylase-like protein